MPRAPPSTLPETGQAFDKIFASGDREAAGFARESRFEFNISFVIQRSAAGLRRKTRKTDETPGTLSGWLTSQGSNPHIADRNKSLEMSSKFRRVCADSRVGDMGPSARPVLLLSS
jgi:hypothetical protein